MNKFKNLLPAVFRGKQSEAGSDLALPSEQVDYSPGLRQIVSDTAGTIDTSLYDEATEGIMYLIKVETSDFPTPDSFTAFLEELHLGVIKEGGHSGSGYDGWSQRGKIAFPLTLAYDDPKISKQIFFPKSAIEIDPTGTLTVGIDGLVVNQLRDDGYLDQGSRHTFSGTGELGRVLDLITNIAPKHTGKPIVGIGSNTEVEVRRYPLQNLAELTTPNDGSSGSPLIPYSK